MLLKLPRDEVSNASKRQVMTLIPLTNVDYRFYLHNYSITQDPAKKVVGSDIAQGLPALRMYGTARIIWSRRMRHRSEVH